MSPNSDSILSQELSRRTALKALFGAASAAVLFGLPTRAHAAEASKETTDKLNAAQAQLDEVQAQLDSIANEYAALANKNAQTLNDIENVQGKIDDTQAQIDEKTRFYLSMEEAQRPFRSRGRQLQVRRYEHPVAAAGLWLV